MVVILKVIMSRTGPETISETNLPAVEPVDPNVAGLLGLVAAQDRADKEGSFLSDAKLNRALSLTGNLALGQWGELPGEVKELVRLASLRIRGY